MIIKYTNLRPPRPLRNFVSNFLHFSRFIVGMNFFPCISLCDKIGNINILKFKTSKMLMPRHPVPDCPQSISVPLRFKMVFIKCFCLFKNLLKINCSNTRNTDAYFINGALGIAHEIMPALPTCVG